MLESESESLTCPFGYGVDVLVISGVNWIKLDSSSVLSISEYSFSVCSDLPLYGGGVGRFIFKLWSDDKRLVCDLFVPRVKSSSHGYGVHCLTCSPPPCGLVSGAIAAPLCLFWGLTLDVVFAFEWQVVFLLFGSPLFSISDSRV